MAIEQRPSGIEVVSFNKLEVGVPTILTESVDIYTFVLKDQDCANGAQPFNGNLHGSVNLIEQLRYEKNFEYLRGWGVSSSFDLDWS